MWTMVIADDEPIIIRGIQKMVNWDKLGIDIVGSCNDGITALKEIVGKKPDIAVLDISMPGKTGLDILKELNYMQIPTKVIFISGFQQFEYAVEALRLGAVNYLLKPINKADLVNNVKEALNLQEISDTVYDLPQAERGGKEPLPEMSMPAAGQVDYDTMIQIEDACYVPAAVYLFKEKELSSVERHLIEFSVYHEVEKYIQDHEMGIVFYKDKKPCIVFKNCSVVQAKARSGEVVEHIFQTTGNRIGLAVGKEVGDMSLIPESYQEALKKIPYFYFASTFAGRVLVSGERVFLHDYTYQDMKKSGQRLMEAVLELNEEKIQKEFEQYKRIVSCVADGDKETAVFHLLTVIRTLEERMDHMGVSSEKIESSLMISRALEAVNYEGMCRNVYEFLNEFIGIVQGVMINNDKKEIIKAKAYIEDHYTESLTLDVLAQYVHMNSSYFSSYFKKQTGENFKEYLNKVRLGHALELLLSTDMKSYEIAGEVGFSDSRYFSELFQKAYGKTPMAYRKELKNKQ